MRRILISTNDHPDYIQFWPLIAKAFKQLFDIRPTLVYVTTQKSEWVESFGEVIYEEPRLDMPTKNWAKLARILHYADWPEDQTMIFDVDMLPLTPWFINHCFKHHRSDALWCVQPKNYFGKKFPGVYMIATGKVWKDIINPKNLDREDLLNSWRGLKKHDVYEDFMKNNFSEESLMYVCYIE